MMAKAGLELVYGCYRTNHSSEDFVAELSKAIVNLHQAGSKAVKPKYEVREN